MGGATSRVKNETINSAIFESFTETIQTCVGSAEAIVKINVENAKCFILDGARIKQSVTMDTSCVMDASITREIERKLKTKLEQGIKNDKDTISIGSMPMPLKFTDTKVDGKVVNEMINKIQVRNKQECLSRSLASFDLNVTNINGCALISNLEIDQAITSSVKDCVMKALEETGVMDDIVSDANQNATETVSSTQMMVAAFGLIVIGLAIYAYVKTKSGGKIGGLPGPSLSSAPSLPVSSSSTTSSFSSSNL